MLEITSQLPNRVKSFHKRSVLKGGKKGQLPLNKQSDWNVEMEGGGGPLGQFHIQAAHLTLTTTCVDLHGC